MHLRFLPSAVVCVVMLWPAMALADFPVIERATRDGDRISVTLSHPDAGWDHYADGWEVLTPDGRSLGVRVLGHPHVEEQPFTRTLSGVKIPEGITELRIRTRCNRDGWSDHVHTLTLD